MPQSKKWQKRSLIYRKNDANYKKYRYDNLKENLMATYECSKCGMSVNATCGKCDKPLVDDMLKLDDGNQVQISKCPDDHGKN